MESSYRCTENDIFIRHVCSFNFPKAYIEMFGIKSNTCYKVVIRISHSNLHMIVNSKTFQSKQILCSRATNKLSKTYHSRK